MSGPPSRRKPAKELEVRISSGDASAVGKLIDLLDTPLHRHLCAEFPALLTLEDREDLIMGLIADLVEDPSRYKKDLASIQYFAKLCIYRKAIDLLRKRGTQMQYEMGYARTGMLSLVQPSPLDEVEYRLAVERVKLVLEEMPANHQAAAHAFVRFGPNRYAAEAARELGVKPNTVAKWMQRVRETIAEATGLKLLDEEQKE